MKKFLSYKGRSVWKGFYFLSRDDKSNILPRNIVFEKNLMNRESFVHNGKNYVNFNVSNNNLVVGFKPGQFFPTKKTGFNIHLLKKKTKKK